MLGHLWAKETQHTYKALRLTLPPTVPRSLQGSLIFPGAHVQAAQSSREKSPSLTCFLLSRKENSLYLGLKRRKSPIGLQVPRILHKLDDWYLLSFQYINCFSSFLGDLKQNVKKTNYRFSTCLNTDLSATHSFCLQISLPLLHSSNFHTNNIFSQLKDMSMGNQHLVRRAV